MSNKQKFDSERAQVRAELSEAIDLLRRSDDQNERLLGQVDDAVAEIVRLRVSLGELLHYARNCGCSDHEMLDKASRALGTLHDDRSDRTDPNDLGPTHQDVASGNDRGPWRHDD